MRSPLTLAKLQTFMEEVGRRAEGPGRVYFVGGSTALFLGFRDTTVDIDLKLDPEPKAIFESIAAIKELLSVNVELASPDQFLPELPGWRERSEFIGRVGPVKFYHYDFYSQVLAKVSRGYEKDLRDCVSMVKSKRVDTTQLLELFESVVPQMIRYPAIDPDALRERLTLFVKEVAVE